LIVEDLGLITPDVDELREELGFPGMRVLQFAFGSNSENNHLPHHHIRNMAVYTGTHDNDTTVGWFKSRPPRSRERRFCLKYLKAASRRIQWDFMRAALASVANIAIIPLQDLLGLDSTARMNLPATNAGNWSWRFSQGALTPTLANKLKKLSQ